MKFLIFILSGLSILGCFSLSGSQPESAKDLYESALIYETGNDSIPPDPDKSFILYKKAAELGYNPARNYLGFLYYNAEGVTHNVDSALYWIRLAAENGDIKAAGNLGYLLSYAPDINHDYIEAVGWLTKATEAGLPTSYTQLAELKRRGLGCEPDTLAAINLYEKAINIGVSDAQQRLLAMMGYKWKSLPPDSALSLGLKYYTGRAPVVGIELIENAAKSNNTRALALLGDAYSRGIGVPYNHNLSTEYFLKASLLGNSSAQFILAEVLDFFPDSVDDTLINKVLSEFNIDFSFDDIKSSQFWYDKAARAGVLDADEAYEQLFQVRNLHF